MYVRVQADSDGNGTLNCEEFVTLAVHLKKMNSEELLREAFLYFDKDGSGYIEFEELQEALIDDHFGPSNEQVIHDIIFDADIDKVHTLSQQPISYCHVLKNMLLIHVQIMFQLKIDSTYWAAVYHYINDGHAYMKALKFKTYELFPNFHAYMNPIV